MAKLESYFAGSVRVQENVLDAAVPAMILFSGMAKDVFTVRVHPDVHTVKGKVVLPQDTARSYFRHEHTGHSRLVETVRYPCEK